MDSKDTQLELHKTLEEIQNIKNVRKHYAKTTSELTKAYKELEKFEKLLDKEYNDWKQLESMSLKSLFHKVLGSKEEQIEKERQEYLQASLKFNGMKKTVDILEYEKSLLEKKLIDVTLLENKLKTLKKQRSKELMNSNSPIGKELRELLKKMDRQVILRNEIRRAIHTGNEAAKSLERMLAFLQQAKNWGNWDMAGKGRMASYNKHDAVDRARETAFQAKHVLGKFQQELYNLGAGSFTFDIRIDSLSSFTDIFFDNLISDWIIQQKIKNALSNVYSVKDKVNRIVQSLGSDLQKVDQQVETYNQAKEQIILNS
ncbi:hypothetical protein [Portibacter lacus]|uniref:Uncharacterized protein n=1 Tax=Portibacter lacus TaxID=1099794 RepID=A0AA37WDR9_9BACT|nr:hypothetical protein [Portibacter lacus]GLR16257.1 hypothetical protein GCM10007940_08720 [Portibacter lacus]